MRLALPMIGIKGSLRTRPDALEKNLYPVLGPVVIAHQK